MEHPIKTSIILLSALLIVAAWPVTAGTAANPEIDDATGEDNGQTLGLTPVPTGLDIDKVWIEALSQEVTFHIEFVDLADPTHLGTWRYYKLAWDDPEACPGSGQYRVFLEISPFNSDPLAAGWCQTNPDNENTAGVRGDVSAAYGVGPSGNEIQFTLARESSRGVGSGGYSGIQQGSELTGLEVRTWESSIILLQYPAGLLGYADQADSPGPFQV